MKILGYIAKSSYRDTDMWLSGTKWVDDIMKLKIGDIHSKPFEIKMDDWPMMDKEYHWAKITITIEL